MLKFAFVFLSLISSFSFIYLPLDNKEIGLNIEDKCYYKEKESFKEYVSSCPEGYYCKKKNFNNDEFIIGVCLNYTHSLKLNNEECTSDEECNPNLKCINKICSLPSSGSPYQSIDPVSNENNYYCAENTFAIDSSGSLTCTDKIDNNLKDRCYYKSSDGQEQTAYPIYMKVKGEKVLSGNKDYVENILSNDIGSLEIKDSKFVENEIACSTGIALYFNNEKGITQPTNDIKEKICVEVKGVSLTSSNKCSIRYIKGNEESIYGENVNSELYDENDFTNCEFIMLKQDLFQNYLKIYNNLKEECSKGKYYDEPYTCGDDELRKLWYYYNNPQDYLLYKNDPDIISYLVQYNYPNTYEKKANSKGLLINLYFIFFILLSL